jgi:signal transduction histidine kinase
MSATALGSSAPGSGDRDRPAILYGNQWGQSSGRVVGAGGLENTGHFESVRAGWDRLRSWDNDHRMWTDVLIAATLLLLCLGFLRQFAVDRPASAIIQLALIAPLVWRRRAPMTVFLVVAAVALVEWLTATLLPADIALLVALFTVAVHDRPSRSLAAAGILEVGVVMASVRWSLAGDPPRSTIFLSGMVVAALFVGITLRTWRAYLDSLVERANQLEYERDQQARLAAAAERSRIAREMHDVVAHNVSIMVTLADGARAVAKSDPDRARETMAEVSSTGRLALTDMRQLLGVLRTEGDGADRNPQPDLTSLPRLIEGVRGTGLRVHLEVRGDPFEIPPGVGLTVYRIVQESLTNVLKHADHPTSAHVGLDYRSPFVDLLVEDDGRSTHRHSDGHGLCGMAERAAIYGGQLVAGPGPSGGWLVTARIRADGVLPAP